MLKVKDILKPKSVKEIKADMDTMSNEELVKDVVIKNKIFIGYALQRDLSPSLVGEILILVAVSNDFETAQQILDTFDVDQTKIGIAISSAGSDKMGDFIMSHSKFNPSSKNNRLFRWAATNGYVNLVTKLLNDPRVDPTSLNNAALKGAFAYGQNSIVRLLKGDKRILMLK